jgi:hypothetical protein
MDRVKNEELQRTEEEKNILHAVIRRNAKCIGHILRGDNLLKHVVEGKIEVTDR